MRKSQTTKRSRVPQRRVSFMSKPEYQSENIPFSLKLRETAKYLKSPLFSIQMILFSIGNCTVSLSLNVANDLICRETDNGTSRFNKIQKEFEIARGIVATLSCFFMGLATDYSTKIWERSFSRNKDVQKTLLRI